MHTYIAQCIRMQTDARHNREGFLYLVASSLLMYELRVSSIDAAKKTAAQEAQKIALDERLTRIEQNMQQLQEQWRIKLELEETLRIQQQEEEKRRRQRSWWGFAAAGSGNGA